MDISVIDATKVNTETGLHIGESNAPVKMIEFINVRCPYCRKWFEESEELLAQSVKSGKVERIIKLFDKEKESLQRGNVMHHYIDYSAPEQALSALHKMFATQDEWGNLTLEEVATYAEKNLGLKEQKDATLVSAVIAEADAAHIQFVPTIIIGEHIFDESVTEEELRGYIEK